MFLNKVLNICKVIMVRQTNHSVKITDHAHYSRCLQNQAVHLLNTQRCINRIHCDKGLFSHNDLLINSTALFHMSGVSYSKEKRRCWNCSSSLDFEDMFCQSCNSLNRIDDCVSYFEIFGQPEKFNLNVQELSKKFKLLQTKLHPDKYSVKSERELDIATECSSVVNNAFKTIHHPLNRGIYMLERKGMALHEGEIAMESSFLMKIMQIHETLAETDDLQTVQSIGKDNKATLGELFIKLEAAFDSNRIADAKSLISELKYYTNIDDKVKQFEQRRGIYHD